MMELQQQAYPLHTRIYSSLSLLLSSVRGLPWPRVARSPSLPFLPKQMKKNYIINCDFIQDVLGPMMRSPKLTRTDADIKVAVRAWANSATRAAAEITYGHISDWETSQVINMEKLFYGNNWDGGDANMQSFNDDISRWDTSNVTTMDCMFNNAHVFNGDLSRWHTSNVTIMDCMFDNARAFNGDVRR